MSNCRRLDAGSVAGDVHAYHTLRTPVVVSLVWVVASAVVPVMLPVEPEMAVALAKASLAGGAASTPGARSRQSN